MAEVAALTKQVQILQAAMAKANGAAILNSGVARGMANLTQTRQLWDQELRHQDKMVQAMNKRKMGMTQFLDIQKNMNKLVDQQLRLQNSTMKTLPGGASMMMIPPKSAIEGTTSAMTRSRMEMGMMGQALKGLGTQWVDWGKNTQWAGRQLMVGFTVPFAAAAAAAGVYFYQIDKLMVQIEKVYNGSTEGLRDMATETAKMVSTAFGAASKDTLAVMGELAAIGKQGTELQEATLETMRLSVLGDMDKETSLKAVVAMQATFQMSTQELANTINYMNQIENETSLTMTDFANAIPRAAAPIAQLGGSMQDLSLLMVAMKERGIEAGQGANAIKTIMTRLLNPTKIMNEEFQSMTGQSLPGIVEAAEGHLIPTIQSIQTAMDNANLSAFEQQKLLSRLGGAYQVTRLSAIFQGLKGDSEQMVNALRVQGMSTNELFLSAFAETSKVVNSASGQFNRAVESFKIQWLDFGETALRTATVFIKTISSAFEAFNSLPEFVKTWGLLLAGVVAGGAVLLMIIGLTGNLIGNIARLAGWTMRMLGQYKALTIAQKGEELQLQNLNIKFMNQSELTQVLVFQLDRLRAAYLSVGQAQQAAMIGMSGAAAAGKAPAGFLANGTAFRPFRAADGTERNRAVDPNTGKFTRELDTNEQKQSQALLASQRASAGVADNQERASKSARIFNSTTAGTVGMVAIMAGSLAGADSAMSNILITAGLGLTIFSLMGPALLTAFNIIKLNGGVALALLALKAKAVGAAMMAWGPMGAGGAHRAETATSRAMTRVGGLAKSAGRAVAAGFSALFGPIGLAIAVAAAAIYGINRLMTATARKNIDIQAGLVNTTEGYATALNKPLAKWGEIRDVQGNVIRGQAALLAAMREDNKPIIDEFSRLNAGGSGDIAAVMAKARQEIFRLQGQGFNEDEIKESMRALLTAAGVTGGRLEQIFSDIEVSFDFNDSQRDLDSFATDMSKRLKDSLEWGPDSVQGAPGFWDNIIDNSGAVTGRGLPFIQQTAATIRDRMITMSDEEKSIYSARITSDFEEVMRTGLADLESKFGKDLGENIWEAADRNLRRGEDGRYQNVGGGQDGLDRMQGDELARQANAYRELYIELSKNLGIGEDVGRNARNLTDIWRAADIQGLNTAQATAMYTEALKKAEEGGKVLTQEEKIRLAQLYAIPAGLDAVAMAQGEYNLSMVDGTNATREQIEEHNAMIDSLQSLNSNLEEIGNGSYGAKFFDSTDWAALGEDATAQASAIADATKNAMSATQSEILSEADRIYDEAFNERMEFIATNYDKKREALEAEGKQLDKMWDKRMDSFKDRWDAVMDASKKSFEDRKKAIDKSTEDQINAVEAEAKAREDAIDRQIKTIEDQQKAEEDLNEHRQRMFEAEEKRIQRMNELAQGRISYNRAIAEGNLDEASRVSGNMATSVSSWANQDAQSAADLASQGRVDAMGNKIEGLQNQKEGISEWRQQRIDEINAVKDAKLEALRIEEENVTASLERQREVEQRHLEEQKSMEKERLQNRIDGLQKEQRAKEETERKKNEAAKRAMEDELATLRAFIPRNEAELKEHQGRIEAVYRRYGVDLQIQGDQWGQFVGDSLTRNVEVARSTMANGQSWAEFGRITADSITKGAFGMSIGDFWNTIITGKLPERWQSPGGAMVSDQYRGGVPNSQRGGRHTGGLINRDPGTRAGRTGGLKKGEREIVALDGEYMLQKSVVDKLGTGTLDALNSGQLGIGGPEQIGYSGLGMAMGAIMLRSMIEAAFFSANDSAAGFDGQIGSKPGVFAGVSLNAEQIANANIIASVGKQLGASARDIQIALMTAMQESTLRNINYGDRDSLGLFQQRAAWGSAADRTNPAASARMFFLGGRGGQPGLFSKRNRNMMTLAQAAQAVQVSAFPGAYAKWEAMAAALMGGGLGGMGAGTGLGLFGRAFQQIAGGGGPGVQNALAWARTQHGKPYQWGGGGNPSWDCSGFMGAIAKSILGEKPIGHPFSTHSFSPGRPGPMGFMPGLGSPNGFSIGVKHGNPGHMAGTLGGVNVESAGGGAGVRVGGPVGATHRMFTMFFHLPAAGAGNPLGGTPLDMPSNYDAYNSPTSSQDFDGTFLRPAQGPVVSEYGSRTDPMTGKERAMHTGTDIGAREGTPIRATAGGTVIKVEDDPSGLGKHIVIAHPGGLYSTYGHMQSTGLKAGQNVTRGQLAGKVGKTGRATGPHLHLQFANSDGQLLDPKAFIPSLAVGGNIKFDDTLANLHRGETVLTSPLSSALERGINKLDSGDTSTYNTYQITIEGSGLTAEQVVAEIDRKKMINDKRRGAIR